MAMETFNSRYCWLCRRLLTFMGQWPYQDRSTRYRRIVTYTLIVAGFVTVQVAKLVTSKRTATLWIEIIGNELVAIISVVKYFSYIIYDNEIRYLLDSMNDHWTILENKDEVQIIEKISQDGDTYVLHCAGFFSLGFIFSASLMISTPFVDIILPSNTSHPRLFLYPGEYFIDEHKYFYPITMHMIITVGTAMAAIVATDTLYMYCLHHACGIFQIVSYRLEHALDNNDICKKSSDQQKADYSKIIKAVECHRMAVRFSEYIVATYEWPHFISLVVSLGSISLTLYSAVILKESKFKLIVGLIFGFGQIFHLFMMAIPPQKLIDNSSMIPYKAYSSRWYAAPVSAQSLLLLIMQRGLKPCTMAIGRVYTISLENYCSEVKATLSYFTVLSSVQ